MKICDQCHGNGYISVDVKVYEDCPKCHCEGELEDVLMEEQGE
jgi:RecJ-like exonuclease